MTRNDYDYDSDSESDNDSEHANSSESEHELEEHRGRKERNDNQVQMVIVRKRKSNFDSQQQWNNDQEKLREGNEDTSDSDEEKRNLRKTKEKINLLYKKIYRNDEYVEERREVVNELRKMVREYIWPYTKFVKGEGHYIKTTVGIGRKPKKRKATIRYGISHEWPNLNTRFGKQGYQMMVMKKMNLDKNSDMEKALWWKTYEGVVKDEIQKLRSNKATDIKRCMIEGELLKNFLGKL